MAAFTAKDVQALRLAEVAVELKSHSYAQPLQIVGTSQRIYEDFRYFQNRFPRNGFERFNPWS